jgi:hypothetical protein
MVANSIGFMAAVAFILIRELWTPYLFYNKDATRDPQDNTSFLFDRYTLFKDAFVDWHEFDHPQYGKIEIGGFKKNFGRAHPGFLLESDAHRNMSFTVYHCYHTPKLNVDTIIEKIRRWIERGDRHYLQQRLMPTHSSQDLKYKIERPDYITLGSATPLAAMIVDNADPNITIRTKDRFCQHFG